MLSYSLFIIVKRGGVVKGLLQKNDRGFLPAVTGSLFRLLLWLQVPVDLHQGIPEGGQEVGGVQGLSQQAGGPLQVQTGAPGALGPVAAVDHQQQAVPGGAGEDEPLEGQQVPLGLYGAVDALGQDALFPGAQLPQLAVPGQQLLVLAAPGGSSPRLKGSR